MFAETGESKQLIVRIVEMLTKLGHEWDPATSTQGVHAHAASEPCRLTLVLAT